jgi:hypothetical protein
LFRIAISLGGDTDTIASMAGAITGAYLGIQVRYQLIRFGKFALFKYVEDPHSPVAINCPTHVPSCILNVCVGFS